MEAVSPMNTKEQRTQITIEGIENAKKYLSASSDAVSKGIFQGMKSSCLLMVGEVKLSIAGRRDEYRSVDTGRFLNSVDYEYSAEEGKVFSDVEYSKFLEYGTSSNFESNITARKHFRNSLYRNQYRVNEILNNEITNSVNNVTKLLKFPSYKSYF